MAKTTSTTKAKTKTTKKKPAAKPATKAAKTTKAVASRAKTATKKTAVKTVKKTKAASKTVVAAKASKPANAGVAVLNRAQVLLGVLFAALAVAAGFLMNTSSVQVLLGHLTKDELASTGGTVLAPAAHVLYEIEFRWLLVAMLAVLSVWALLRGTRYFARENADVTRKVAPLRWVDYAITAGFGFTIAALLNGLQDFVALKLGVISLFVAAVLAWAYERENAATGKPARVTYLASVVLTVAPVVLLLVTMYATWMYGMVRSPWYAYAAAGVVVVSLLASLVMLKNKRDFKYEVVDRNFGRLAAVSKVALAAILIVGLYK